MSKNDNLGELYLTQKSLSEWLHDIAHQNTDELRHEDNEKRERLRALQGIINIPFDTPVQFAASDISEHSDEHEKYLHEHADELCALRLIPLDSSLPKLRMRGMSVKDVQQWFVNQHIDAKKYRAEYIPHTDNQTWSTIFVVSDKGIFGEIIRGRHNQLTQGLYEEGNQPRTFSYDFSTWNMEPNDDEALSVLQDIVARIHTSQEQQTQIKNVLDASFAGDYLKGYFETVSTREFGLWFVDYAPKMGERLNHFYHPLQKVESAIASGQAASVGDVVGSVYVVEQNNIHQESFPDGAILVCKMTTPDLVPLMQKAGAIVTDQGGILSHAAIVARELGVPCVVGTGNATQVLETGMKVRVDATNGAVYHTDLSE